MSKPVPDQTPTYISLFKKPVPRCRSPSIVDGPQALPAGPVTPSRLSDSAMDKLSVSAKRMHGLITVSIAAVGLACLDPASKATSGLVGKVLQMERIHRVLRPTCSSLISPSDGVMILTPSPPEPPRIPPDHFTLSSASKKNRQATTPAFSSADWLTPRGRLIVKHVPFPGFELTRIWPLCPRVINMWDRARPWPLPRPGSLVVKSTS